jgi:two-component system, response regulator YesN
MEVHSMKTEKRLYKVVIVDDEPLIIEGLITMIHWENQGYEILDTFTRSEEALNFLFNTPVDLLITDVRMPGIDGLTLIKEIKAYRPSTQVIIMSGYRDFAYVKLAMTYGALSYIVKPIFEEDLVPLLKKSLKELNQRIQEEFYLESSQKERLIAYVQSQQQRIRETKEVITQYLAHLGKDAIWTVLTVWKGYQGIDRECLYQLLETKLHNYPIIELHYQKHGMIVMIQQDNKVVQSILEHQNYVEVYTLDEVHPRMDTISGVDNFSLFLDDLVKLYETRRLELSQYHHFQSTTFELPMNWILKKGHLTQDVVIDKDLLALSIIEWLDKQEDVLLYSALSETLKYIISQNNTIEQGIHLLTCIYEKVMILIMKKFEIKLQKEEFLDIQMLKEASTMEETILFLEERWTKILLYVKVSQAFSKEGLRNTIDTYMDEHYTEPLTIKQLSEIVHMHPTYLGQKLCQIWGESFTQHIHKVRIEKSLQVLQTLKQEECIEEVAYLMGYSSYSVFLKYFKQLMGKTPKDYVKEIHLNAYEITKIGQPK